MTGTAVLTSLSIVISGVKERLFSPSLSMSILGDTLFGDLMSLNCEKEQPFRVGLGFSYEEVEARCKAVVREDSERHSEPGQLPPLSGSYYDQGLGANIVNVDEPRQVALSSQHVPQEHCHRS